MASFQDVNSDGRLDLVVQVNTEALQLSATDTQAIIEGQTFDGMSIIGFDSVQIVASGGENSSAPAQTPEAAPTFKP
jgi:hypothetical protein